jgi:hypothetical protein
MSNNVDLLAIVNCLQSDAFLSGLINVAAPQVIVMPFAKDPARSYLFVAVFFYDSNLRKEVIFNACKRIVALLRREYLATFDGLEILASVVVGTSTERVLRLSMLKDSLDVFEKMNNLELNTRVPAAGITNLMYKQIS